MIWQTDTHVFTATICQRTGKTCPALARMARTMAQAMSQAGPVTHSNFEMEGSLELNHCHAGCTARFRARIDHIRIYCGVSSGTPSEQLDAYTDMMFGSACRSLPSGTISEPPCALLEANATPPQRAPASVSHAAR